MRYLILIIVVFSREVVTNRTLEEDAEDIEGNCNGTVLELNYPMGMTLKNDSLEFEKLFEDLRITNITNLKTNDSYSSKRNSFCCQNKKKIKLFRVHGNACCRKEFRFVPPELFHTEHIWVSSLDQDIPFIVLEICYLTSFISLCIIFISAIVSSRFRRERGNQILVYFAFSIFARNILYILGCFIQNTHYLCDFESVAFHYFALVERCWTGIIACMQYKRYVKVLSSESEDSVCKLISVAYGVPILPMLFRIFYNQPNSDIRWLSISIPQLIALIFNSVILIMIMKSILCMKNAHIESKKTSLLEMKLIFFLFSILDFSWLGIILSYLTSKQLFAYLYSFTQSTQGFMLFFVFGIMNSRNRFIYKRILTSVHDSVCGNWYYYDVTFV